jgi:hypothetical protein
MVRFAGLINCAILDVFVKSLLLNFLIWIGSPQIMGNSNFEGCYCLSARCIKVIVLPAIETLLSSIGA